MPHLDDCGRPWRIIEKCNCSRCSQARKTLEDEHRGAMALPDSASEQRAPEVCDHCGEPMPCEEYRPCSVCGCEERGQGGYLQCECPSPLKRAPASPRAKAWEEGYAHGYDDREKMDHDRADVIKTTNPYIDTPDEQRGNECTCEVKTSLAGHSPECPLVTEQRGDALYVPRIGERVRIVEINPKWPTRFRVGDIVTACVGTQPGLDTRAGWLALWPSDGGAAICRVVPAPEKVESGDHEPSNAELIATVRNGISINVVNGWAKRARAALTELEKRLGDHESNWAECADGHPEPGEPVWFVVDGIVREGDFDLSASYWNEADGCWPIERATHWKRRYVQPEPSPPRGDHERDRAGK